MQAFRACAEVYTGINSTLCSVIDAYICALLLLSVSNVISGNIVLWGSELDHEASRCLFFFPAGHPVWQHYSLLETLLIKQRKILHMCGFS